MKKRILSIILVFATLLFGVSSVFAEGEKVEIAFKVGDSVLSINGSDVEVETPYIAGEGTTLVPLRVITEAFGAQVNWEGETKTITLTYPDVNIVLQIDNIVAKVNDHSETLPEAPALSANGVTMVPLRFISETFGAEVGYDNETQAITVTKEIIDDSNTVTGVTDKNRIGDNYYNWSIDTPRQMTMTERRDDGLLTVFESGNSDITIRIYKRYEDSPSFDEEFTTIKDMLSSHTLVEAKKLKDSSNNDYMLLQAKDSETFIEYREYFTKEYIYAVVSTIDLTEESSKDMILALSDSFELKYDSNNTHNLSNVESSGSLDLRNITNEKYKVSFKVPANYGMTSSSNTENEFTFMSMDENSRGYVSLAIYSKTENVTAESLAYSDRAVRVRETNPDLATISDVTSSSNDGFRYTQKIAGSKNSDSYLVDTFFEVGSYVYNFTVCLDNPEDSMTMSTLLSSLKAEELDPNEIGQLLRNDPDENNTKTSMGSFDFELPSFWKKSANITSFGDEDSVIYESTVSNANLSITKSEDTIYTNGRVSDIAADFASYIDSDDKNTIITKTQYTSVNGRRFAYFTYLREDDDYAGYTTVYMVAHEGELLIITLIEDDIYFTETNDPTIETILDTLTVK